VYYFASDKSIQSIRRKVKALTRRSWLGEDPAKHILRINRMLRGWANYFQHATGKRVLSQLGWYARTRVCRWLRETHKGRKQMTWKEFKRRYIVPGKGPVVGGVALFNPGTVPVARYLYRGNTIPAPWKAA
jgi:RNA-directed DNA polymerase